MKNFMNKSVLLKATIVSIFSLVCTGCVMLVEPRYETVPQLPSEFGRINVSHSGDCPDLNGVYSRIPLNISLNKEGNIKQIKKETSAHYAVLLGVVLKGSERREEFDNILNSSELFIRQQNKALRIAVKHLKEEYYLVTNLAFEEVGFSCKGGKMLVREKISKGGGDGIAVNFRMYIEVQKMENNDLLFYEQIATPNYSKHNYYLYRYLRTI